MTDVKSKRLKEYREFVGEEDSVCKAYSVDIKSLLGIHRGVTNEARKIAIYLTRLPKHDSLKEIGKEFKISNYSSVRSTIEEMRADVVSNKKPRIQVEKIRKNVC